MGETEQEVVHSRGGCYSRRALKGSAEMTSMGHTDKEVSSVVLRYTILSRAPE
jgi:hypothetical protein